MTTFTRIKKELTEYFQGTRKKFTLPINPQGTPFEKKVWRATAKIPYGETRTYQEIARMIKNPKSARAVGNALGKNPIPILIPCHRVVGSNSLGGFSYGIQMKKKLLALESKKN